MGKERYGARREVLPSQQVRANLEYVSGGEGHDDCELRTIGHVKGHCEILGAGIVKDGCNENTEREQTPSPPPTRGLQQCILPGDAEER